MFFFLERNGDNELKIVKLLTIAGSFLIASSLSSPQKVEAAVMSGSLCEAANLNQALQGIGWSQAGVKNNATSSFFVVCGLSWVFGSTFTEGVRVNGAFPNSTGGIIECTVRSNDFITGTFITSSFTIDNTLNGFGQGVAAFPALDSFPNATIVCALDPGEGIDAYWTVS